MKFRFAFAIVFVLGQVHLNRGNPAIPMPFQNNLQMQPNSGMVQSYLAPQPDHDIHAQDRVAEADGFKPPSYQTQPQANSNFMPSYAPSYQFPYPNYYQGMLPQYRTAPKLNVDDTGDAKGKVKKPKDDRNKHNDGGVKDNGAKIAKASSYQPNLLPAFYGTPANLWRPIAMPFQNNFQMQPNSGMVQSYLAPQPDHDIHAQDKVAEADGFKPPSYKTQPQANPNFMTSYVPSYQFPYPNNYQGMLPQYRAAPKLNVDDTGDTKGKVKKPKDDKHNDDAKVKASSYKPNFVPRFYGPLANLWRPMTFQNNLQMQPNSGMVQSYLAPQPDHDIHAQDRVAKADGFKPPSYQTQPQANSNFMPSYNAPNYQFPYPNYYQGMLPQYRTAPKFNMDDTGDAKGKVKKPKDERDKHNDDAKEKSSSYKPNFMPGFYAPGFPYLYPGYYPANQAQQFYYPNGQPAAPAYSPYNQGSPYGYQQQEQRYNDEQKVDLPPPPKIPELMSTLVQLSKNRRRYPATCSSCNKCSQCYKSARCAQCDFCKNRLCDEAATSMPLIPKNLRPLWEMWNERTADMNSMEMSALILKPFHKIKKSKAKKVHGSSSKRSHIKKPKITQVAKKSTKKNSKN